MNLLNKATYLIICLIFFSACSQPKPNKYQGALQVANQYLPINNLNEGDLVFFYSRYSGCEGCRSYFEQMMEVNGLANNSYLITNSKHVKPIHNLIFFDSLDLLDKTDLGFVGPTILRKSGQQLEYVLEVKPENQDSLLLYLKR